MTSDVLAVEIVPARFLTAIITEEGPVPPAALRSLETAGSDVLRDDDKRRACMHDHRAELSKDCLAAIAKSRQGD